MVFDLSHPSVYHVQDNAFHWLLLMACLYLLGATLYATRTPERFFPGKCDIWVRD